MPRSDLPDVFSVIFVVAVNYWLVITTNDPNFQRLFFIIFTMFYTVLGLVVIYGMFKNNAFEEDKSKITEHNKKESRKCIFLHLVTHVGLFSPIIARPKDPLQTILGNVLVAVFVIGFIAFFVVMMYEDGILQYHLAKIYLYLCKNDNRSKEEKKKVRFIMELDDLMNYLDEFDEEWEDYMNELVSYDEDETKKQILEFVIYMDRFLNKGTKYTDKMMEEYYELSDKAEEYINPVIINEYSYDNDDHTDMEFITEIDKIVRQFDKFIDKHSEYFNKSYDGLNGFNKLKKKMKKFVDRGEMFVDEMAHDYYFAE